MNDLKQSNPEQYEQLLKQKAAAKSKKGKKGKGVRKRRKERTRRNTTEHNMHCIALHRIAGVLVMLFFSSVIVCTCTCVRSLANPVMNLVMMQTKKVNVSWAKMINM